MSAQTYSRDALRAMPIEVRKQFLRNSIERYIQKVIGSARVGETSCIIELQKDQRGGILVSNIGGMMNLEARPPTIEEIREALLEVFPDCSINYEEKWIQTGPTKQEMKKGLTVDWS